MYKIKNQTEKYFIFEMDCFTPFDINKYTPPWYSILITLLSGIDGSSAIFYSNPLSYLVRIIITYN